MMKVKHLGSFQEGLDFIRNATSLVTVRTVVDQINRQFQAETLEVNSAQWRDLASAIVQRAMQLTR